MMNVEDLHYYFPFIKIFLETYLNKLTHQLLIHKTTILVKEKKNTNVVFGFQKILKKEKKY